MPISDEFTDPSEAPHGRTHGDDSTIAVGIRDLQINDLHLDLLFLIPSYLLFQLLFQ